MPFAETWMDPEIVIPSEVSQKRKTNNIVYMWNLEKMIQINLFRKQTQSHMQRTNLVTKGGDGVGMNWGFRIDAYTLVRTSQGGLVVKTPPAKAGGIKTQV